MIAIVMTYYDRQQQLSKTLASIKGEDFVVIIADDCSPVPVQIPKVRFPVEVVTTSNKRWTDAAPAYNTGLLAAMKYSPDIVIIQNAECYHAGDILGYTLDHLTNDNYIPFSTFSLDKFTTFASHNIHSIIDKNNHTVNGTGKLGWYNHPIHRPVALEFCAAITTENLKKLNGYDERLAHGLSYGDTYLLHRIKAMGLKVEIPENPFVVHQWHYSQTPLPNASQLRAKNKALCAELMRDNTIYAEHLYTNNL